MQLESLGLMGMFVSAFISATVAPGGSEAVLAYLMLQHDHAVEYLVGVATVGNTLGAMTTWWLGFCAAKKFPLNEPTEHWKKKSMVLVRRWGCWALLFSWLPVIGDGFCFAAGWLKLPMFLTVASIMAGKALRYIAFVAILLGVFG